MTPREKQQLLWSMTLEAQDVYAVKNIVGLPWRLVEFEERCTLNRVRGLVTKSDTTGAMEWTPRGAEAYERCVASYPNVFKGL